MNRYDAFISYSHAKDQKIARDLQTVIQNLGKSWHQVRAAAVFRDETSLTASPELWQTIVEALERSSHLIVMASPEAAASQWVNREIEWWLEYKQPGTLVIALTEGHLEWDPQKGDFAQAEILPLPPAARGAFSSEPYWIDLRAWRDLAGGRKRQGEFKAIVSKIAARVRGIPVEDLWSEELRQKKRNLRLAIGAIGALITFTIGSIALSAALFAQWQDGLERESLAIARSSAELLRNDDPINSLLLALEAVPDQKGSTFKELLRPYVPAAESVLRKSSRAVMWYDTVLQAYQDYINDVRFSPDGRFVLTASNDNIARLWDADSLAQVAVFGGHEKSVKEAGFSPDGSRIITSSSDQTIRIWSPRSDKEIAVLKDTLSRQSDDTWPTWQFVSGGRRMLTFFDHRSHLWDVATGLSIASFSASHLEVRPSKDGTKLYAIPKQNDNIITWNATTGKRMAPMFSSQRLGEFSDSKRAEFIRRQFNEITMASQRWQSQGSWTSKDGRRSISQSCRLDCQLTLSFSDNTTPPISLGSGQENSMKVGPDGDVMLKNVNSNAELWDIVQGRKLAVFAHTGTLNVKYHPTKKSIIVKSTDGLVRHWKPVIGWGIDSPLDKPSEEILGLNTSGYEGNIRFSPDGKRIVVHNKSGGAENFLELWDGSLKHRIGMFAPGTWIQDFSFSPDSTKIFVATGDNRVHAWDAKTGERLREGRKYSSGTNSLQISANGKSILVRGAGKLTISSLEGNTIGKLNAQSPEAAEAIFSPDGRIVAAISAEDRSVLQLWNYRANSVTTLRNGSDRHIVSFAFGPDTKRIVTMTIQGQLRLWDTLSGAIVFELKTEAIIGSFFVRYSPAGNRILALVNGAPHIWDAKSGQLVNLLREENGIILTAEFSPDGTYIVTGDENGKVWIWDALTGAALTELKGHSEPILTIAFSHDGARLVTAIGREKGFGYGGSDKSVKVWEIGSGAEIAHLDGHQGAVARAMFSPDGKSVLSRDGHETLRLWKLKNVQDFVDHVKEKINRCLTPEQRLKFGLVRAAPRWCYRLNKWPYNNQNIPFPALTYSERLVHMWRIASGLLPARN